MEVRSNVVVVTGLGWNTALGDDVEVVTARLLAGESGIRPLPSELRLKNDSAGYLEDVGNPDHKARLIEFTSKAVEAALRDARLDGQTPNPHARLIIGTSLGYRLDSEQFHQDPLYQWVDDVGARVGMNALALSTACSSGSDAILLGAHLIRSGQADLCVCGGADVLGDAKRLAHTALGTLSATRLKSFDQSHDGTLLGEGAGFVVLQREGLEKHKPHAYLLGCGAANDAAGLTAPDETGAGIRLALDRALAQADLSRNQVGLINAHGSGTYTNDRVESAAYNEYFGDYHPLVFATKGAFGHTLGATGAIEAIALIKALQTQAVPPVHGLQQPLPNLEFDLPLQRPSSTRSQVGLSLTIGFGGFNTALVFQRFDQ
ncbi:beta-ketoacyl-[acyl-carrier-protein] synthase family protein [Pseudomonas sp. CMR5c]|uniref:beta-ketoacyl-[acyl-carrier-protein] synthase family protein n=1 Tax=Pseudomonas TaxID=286 RepID=UPI00069D5D32|nr:beta-ketoacyl-[acyl-carrier-protein] synthase family protein [Pseudomonas sp. CMR5c]AZC20114.1 3-oxoacyl-ACP synthase, KASII [Pseudomonas sp. CMR5c]